MALIKCGECGKDVSDKANSCPHCGCPIENKESTNTYNYNGKDYNIDGVILLSNQGQKVKAITSFRELTGAGLAEAKKIVDNLPRMKIDSVNSNQVRCPKCGSSDFEMVKRNWSIVTGFMTNKVDRVCKNCKTKF